MKKLIFLSIFILASVITKAEYIPSTRIDSSIYYVDDEIIKENRYDGNLFCKVWVKETGFGIIGELQTKSNTLFLININTREYKVLSNIIYGNDWEIISSQNYDEYSQDWSYIVPESLIYYIFNTTKEIINKKQ